jgi:hypothetical protein
MLVTVKHVQKVFEKVPASDVSKKVEYLLNTGNLVSQSGLDLNQVHCVGNLDVIIIHYVVGASQALLILFVLLQFWMT